jgi:hypothetical protein
MLLTQLIDQPFGLTKFKKDFKRQKKKGFTAFRAP